MINNVLDNLTNTFNEIVQNYISINSKFTINIKKIENDEILSNEVMILQVSMNDLVLQLQNINYKINCMKTADIANTNTDVLDTDVLDTDALDSDALDTDVLDTDALDTNTDNLINKTLNDMLPLFMVSLMNNDSNSLLNSNTFMKNIKDTINNISTQLSTNQQPIPTSSAQSLAQLPTQLPTQPPTPILFTNHMENISKMAKQFFTNHTNYTTLDTLNTLDTLDTLDTLNTLDTLDTLNTGYSIVDDLD